MTFVAIIVGIVIAPFWFYLTARLVSAAICRTIWEGEKIRRQINNEKEVNNGPE
jgi:hypothetical protein